MESNTVYLIAIVSGMVVVPILILVGVHIGARYRRPTTTTKTA